MIWSIYEMFVDEFALRAGSSWAGLSRAKGRMDARRQAGQMLGYIVHLKEVEMQKTPKACLNLSYKSDPRDRTGGHTAPY
jgi:hypothetical protein